MCKFDRIRYNLNQVELLNFYRSMISKSDKSYLNLCATKVLLTINQHGYITDSNISKQFPFNTHPITDALTRLRLIHKIYGLDDAFTITWLGREFLVNSNALNAQNMISDVEHVLSVVLPLMVFVFLIATIGVISMYTSGVLELILAPIAFVTYLIYDYATTKIGLSQTLFLKLAYEHHAFNALNHFSLIRFISTSCDFLFY